MASLGSAPRAWPEREARATKSQARQTIPGRSRFLGEKNMLGSASTSERCRPVVPADRPCQLIRRQPVTGNRYGDCYGSSAVLLAEAKSDGGRLESRPRDILRDPILPAERGRRVNGFDLDVG